jgi:hypothetical protein
LRGGVQHLLARIGDVSCPGESGDRRLSSAIGLHEVSEPTRMVGRCDAQRREDVGADAKPPADGDGVGVDAVTAGELDGPRRARRRPTRSA